MSVLARARVVLEGDVARLHAAFAQAENALLTTGRRMEEIGRDLTAKVSLPIVGVGAASVHTAAQFDHSFRKIAGLTAMSMEQADQLRGAVREMGIQYGASGRDAAEGLLFIVTPALTVQQQMDVLRESLKGAAIGLGDAKTIALGAVGAMNAYAKSGLSATRATEILTAGVKFGRFEAAELIPTLSRLTGVAAAMGISFEDVVGTLSVLTLTGSTTYEASTQLSAIMSTLMGTSQEGERILRGFGLSLQALRDTAAKPGGLIQVFRELNEATGGNLEMLEAVFPNIRALRGIMNALAQDNALVDRSMRGVRDSVGMLDDSFSVFAAAPAFQMKQAFAQIKDALIEIGNVLIPVVIPIMQKVTSAVQDAAMWFGSLPKEMQQVIMVSAALAAALGPVLLVLGGIMKVLSVMKFSLLLGGIAAVGSALGKLFALLKAAAWFSGLHGAFAAAAVAGTGLKGVMIGLLPTLKMIGAALGPFAAGSAIIIGLGAIVYKWSEMRIEVAKVNQALRETGEHMQKVLGGMTKTQAAASWTRLALIVQDMEGRIKSLTAAEAAERAKANEAARASGYAAKVHLDAADALKEQRAALEENVAAYRKQLAILGKVVTAQEAVTTVTQQGAPVTKAVPSWLYPAQEAMRTLTEQLRQAADMQKLFGAQFDIVEAQAQAYTDAIQAMVAAGVPFDTVVGAQGETLRILVERLKAVQAQLEATKAAQDAYSETISRANAAVEAAATPEQVYLQTLEALNVALLEGKITFEQFEAAVQHAQETFDNATQKTNDLARAFQDIARDGVDEFVDGIFGAKASFADFIRSALSDITKLILKMYIMKALFPEDSGPGGIIGKIFGFARGGFLPAGDVGLVGERGPELVMAGRQGMRITPMPANAAARPMEFGGGGGVPVQINVNALDSRDVSRFFEDNEGLVANAMLRAAQRSAALRRRLGGG